MQGIEIGVLLSNRNAKNKNAGPLWIRRSVEFNRASKLQRKLISQGLIENFATEPWRAEF